MSYKQHVPNLGLAFAGYAAELTFKILISLESRFWVFERFFLVMTLIATTKSSFYNKQRKYINIYTQCLNIASAEKSIMLSILEARTKERLKMPPKRRYRILISM